MSKKQNNQSKEALEDRKANSVFDFLYYDQKRVASFLSQFYNFGHLTGLTTSEVAERSKSKTTAGRVSGGIPMVASGDISQETSVGSGYAKDSQRIYDPIWANALKFLDYLTEHNLLIRDIADATMGKFLLHSGSLNVVDLSLIEKIWSMKSFEKSMRQGAVENLPRADRRRAQKPGHKDQINSEMDLFIDLMGVLPHTIQATISGSEKSAWCNLANECLSIEATDITLKHGYSVPGRWNVVGILDAIPDFEVEENVPEISDEKEMASKLMKTLAPMTKNIVGRPKDAYGITPLLVFREVTN